jgi:hypothetical protein
MQQPVNSSAPALPNPPILYAEFLGWRRYHVRNEYCLIGQIDGVLVGIVHGQDFQLT